MKVGGYAFFDDAVFEGPVTFVLAEIAGSFHATGAKFSEQGKASQLQQHEDPRRTPSSKIAAFEGPVNSGLGQTSPAIWTRTVPDFRTRKRIPASAA